VPLKDVFFLAEIQVQNQRHIRQEGGVPGCGFFAAAGKLHRDDCSGAPENVHLQKRISQRAAWPRTNAPARSAHQRPTNHTHCFCLSVKGIVGGLSPENVAAVGGVGRIPRRLKG